MSGNQALDTNAMVGARPDLAITDHGSDWYWAVCALMAVSTFTFMGLSFTKRKTHRLFHYITAGITLVASISYYSMASGLGQTAIQAEFIRPNSIEVAAAGTRQIFWVRYVDYAITTPLILTNLFLTSAIPRPTMLATLLADELMVVCYLAGALTPTSYKWGYFVFGLLGYFFVVYSLMLDGRRYASALGGAINKTYMSCAGLIVFIWFFYPIAWGLSEGGNVIHPDSEAVFYGVLDIFSKIVVGFLLVFGHQKIDPTELGLHIREHSTLPRHEKQSSRYKRRDHIGHNDNRKGVTNHHNGLRDHRDNFDREGHRDGPGLRDHRGNPDRNSHHGGLQGHHDTFDRDGQRGGLTDRRSGTPGHNKELTDHHDGSTEPHLNASGYQDGRANHPHNEGVGRDVEGTDYYDQSFGRHNDRHDYHDGAANNRRRGAKSSGGGILSLFRKKNHYDDANHDYRERDRSPARGGYYARDRSPLRDDYQTEKRSRFKGDYHARDHSPFRGEYRTGQRSPIRGEYRTDDHADGRRSFPRGEYRGGDRRSFPGGEYHRDERRPSSRGEYHADGRRSLPRLDGREDDRRPFLGGDNRGDERRSVPSGENNKDERRYFPSSEYRSEDPRSMPAAETHRQNIRSVPGGEYPAENRRPVPDAEPHRQAGSTALGMTGHGDNRRSTPGDSYRPDNRRPSGDYQPDNRRPSGEFRPDKHQPSAVYQADNRHRSGEFQQPQVSNVTSSNPIPNLGTEHPST